MTDRDTKLLNLFVLMAGYLALDRPGRDEMDERTKYDFDQLDDYCAVLLAHIWRRGLLARAVAAMEAAR